MNNVAPKLELAFEVRAAIGPALVVGPSAHGFRRIIPITGGTVTGERLHGRVVPGGADWQFVRPDGVLELSAKYTLESHDGVMIMVTNTGMRHGPPEVMDRLVNGDRVDPGEYYFRTCARFEAPIQSAYDWLNKAVFVGAAEREAGNVLIRFYQVL